jgi:hypothetical protein
MKISDFLTALATDPALQDAWAKDPKQAALDFGLNDGQATALAQAKTSGNLTPISNMVKQEEGGTVKVFLWIK